MTERRTKQDADCQRRSAPFPVGPLRRMQMGFRSARRSRGARVYVEYMRKNIEHRGWQERGAQQKTHVATS